MSLLEPDSSTPLQPNLNSNLEPKIVALHEQINEHWYRYPRGTKRQDLAPPPILCAHWTRAFVVPAPALISDCHGITGNVTLGCPEFPP